MKKLIAMLITIAMVMTMAVPAFADDTTAGADTAVIKPAKVENIKVSKNSYKSLKITWQSVDGAERYQVYRSTTGKTGSFTLKKTTTGTTYTNTGLTAGKTYYYKVRAVNSAGKGSFSVVKSNKVAPATVKIEKVSCPKDYQVKVAWNKVSGASGYQVYRSQKGKDNWKLFKSVSSKTTSVTDKMVGKMEYDSKGRKVGYDYSDLDKFWEYKVRAYRTVNGKKVYGNFSKISQWTPDWTIEEIYEWVWKYVETMEFPIYEYIEGKDNPDMGGRDFWPTDETYHWKHEIGVNWQYPDYEEGWGGEAECVYTNPANGNTEIKKNFQKKTPNNSNWGVLWPMKISPYMTKVRIKKTIKGKLDVEMSDLSYANPMYWDTDWNEWNGADIFTIYYEKYGIGYKLWQLW